MKWYYLSVSELILAEMRKMKVRASDRPNIASVFWKFKKRLTTEVTKKSPSSPNHRFVDLLGGFKLTR